MYIMDAVEQFSLLTNACVVMWYVLCCMCELAIKWKGYVNCKMPMETYVIYNCSSADLFIALLVRLYSMCVCMCVCVYVHAFVCIYVC